MAHVDGFAATVYAQFVQAVANDIDFEVGIGSNVNMTDVPIGKSPFTDMTASDTIAYRATSLEDPSKWEVGIVTYDGTNDQLTRADASVLASSNSNNTVDFKRSDGSGGGQVLVEGIAGLGALAAAYTITNHTADRAMDCNTAADAEIADVLGSLILDLANAGVIKATVS
jgi:hypothetical protein